MPAQELRDFLLDNKDRMTVDLIARVLVGVFDDGWTLNELIRLMEINRGRGFKGDQ